MSNTHFTLRLLNESIALKLPKLALIIILLICIMIIFMIGWSLNIGSFTLSFQSVYDTLNGTETDKAANNVVWLFRFPRTLAAVLVGIMMALSGAALQNVTRNGLADPSLIGISQGAALAVVASIIVFPEIDINLRPWLALAGSLIVAAIIQWLSFDDKASNSLKLILFGIGVSAFLSSITTAMLTYGDIYNASSALAWLAGSINATNWFDVKLLFIAVLILVPLLLILSRLMATLRLGEISAISLGVPIKFVKYALISLAVALAAIATSVVGPLGFVGLVAPHLARLLTRSNVAIHLILTALIGGLLVLVADFAGRALFAPLQIPAGIVTEIIGVPFLIFLLLSQRRKLNK